MDKQLISKINEAIMEIEDFNEEWNVDVINNGGVITLRGAVPAKEHLKQIEEIVAEQKGVISVINELDIDEDLKKSSTDSENDQNIDIIIGKHSQFGNK